jgi:hypothetical protein
VSNFRSLFIIHYKIKIFEDRMFFSVLYFFFTKKKIPSSKYTTLLDISSLHHTSGTHSRTQRTASKCTTTTTYIYELCNNNALEKTFFLKYKFPRVHAGSLFSHAPVMLLTCKYASKWPCGFTAIETCELCRRRCFSPLSTTATIYH